MTKVVLIDNGHGSDTPGKCSPDGTLREWAWTRECAAMVVAGLRAHGIEAHLLTKETWDVPLSERVRRVNAWCSKTGASNVCVVSIHVNAAGGDRKWHDARGFLAFVSPNASKGSRRLASLIAGEAVSRGHKGNRRQGPVVEKLLSITEYTRCPAVLTENLFMDNRADCATLLSDDGIASLAEAHIEGIERYVNG